MKKELQLLKFILEMNQEIEFTSKKVYTFIQKYLQEDSHSFGFKPLAKISENIIDQLDELYQTKTFEYYAYEQEKIFQDINEFITICENEKEFDFRLADEKKLLSFILDIFQKLYIVNYDIGKDFSLLLTDLKEDTARHSFEPIDNMLHEFIDKLEIEVYPKINYIESDAFKHYGGWFYWFAMECEFAAKKEVVSTYKDIEYKINNIEEFTFFITNILRK